MLIPNNLPGIVGPARSIVTSASLLRRAVRPPTRKSGFAYLADRGDRFCRKGVGIPRRTARPIVFFFLCYSWQEMKTQLAFDEALVWLGIKLRPVITESMRQTKAELK